MRGEASEDLVTMVDFLYKPPQYKSLIKTIRCLQDLSSAIITQVLVAFLIAEKWVQNGLLNGILAILDAIPGEEFDKTGVES